MISTMELSSTSSIASENAKNADEVACSKPQRQRIALINICAFIQFACASGLYERGAECRPAVSQALALELPTVGPTRERFPALRHYESRRSLLRILHISHQKLRTTLYGNSISRVSLIDWTGS